MACFWHCFLSCKRRKTRLASKQKPIASRKQVCRLNSILADFCVSVLSCRLASDSSLRLVIATCHCASICSSQAAIAQSKRESIRNTRHICIATKDANSPLICAAFVAPSTCALLASLALISGRLWFAACLCELRLALRNFRKFCVLTRDLNIFVELFEVRCVLRDENSPNLRKMRKMSFATKRFSTLACSNYSSADCATFGAQTDLRRAAFKFVGSLAEIWNFELLLL